MEKIIKTQKQKVNIHYFVFINKKKEFIRGIVSGGILCPIFREEETDDWRKARFTSQQVLIIDYCFMDIFIKQYKEKLKKYEYSSYLCNFIPMTYDEGVEIYTRRNSKTLELLPFCTHSIETIITKKIN